MSELSLQKSPVCSDGLGLMMSELSKVPIRAKGWLLFRENIDAATYVINIPAN